MNVYAASGLSGLAIAAAVILLALIFARSGYKRIRRKVNRAAGNLGSLAAMAGLAAVASQMSESNDETPRSLSGGDSLYLPQILKDFPDFNLTSAKEKVREYLQERFADAEDFAIHNIIISDYRKAGFEKTIVFQCAYELKEEDQKRQKRCNVHYSYRVSGETGSYAAPNCPNCGAPVAPGRTDCPYCGARLFMTEAAWSITDWYEK